MDAMASFRATRFPGAMFDQNYPRSNFNMNSSAGSQFRPQFQRPPNHPIRPPHTPEGFMAGNFQKPPFLSFPDAAGSNALRTRPPPPNQVFCPQIPPPNQMFRMNPPPPRDQVFRINTPPPDQMFRINTPPPNQMFRMNSSPSSDVFRMNPSPAPEGFRMNPSPAPEVFRMNPTPGPEVFRINPSPAPEVFHMNPSPTPELFRMNAPPPDQSFRSTSVLRPRFNSAPFDRPFRPWNPMTSFRNSPRPPFQNRSQSQSSSYQQKDLPLQANKKRKQKVREFRKLKEDATEKPFSCDTCDRAFVTDDELKEHLSQHIKCDLGNCTFKAHPKIVALHKRMQHETGFADRINRLQDEAEIQKWREERRRRFPTAENIKKRQAEQAEREARGEVLETKEFGKFKRRSEGNGNLMRNRRQVRRRGSFRRHDRTRNFRHYEASQPSSVNLDSDSDSDCDSHIKLKKFLGIQSLTNSVSEKCDPIEDAEVISSPQAPNTAIESISENLSEQNLSKSDSDRVSYADNNSSNPACDETSLVLNNEKVDDVTLPADQSVCEIPENEMECVKQIHEVVTLEDVTLPADESVCEVPENEIECVKQIHKVVTIEDSDDEGPINIPIQMSRNDGDGNQDIDDEGPEIAPISKTVKISITGDSQNIHDSDDDSPVSIPIQKSANGDCGNQGTDNEEPKVTPIVKSVENSISRDNGRTEQKSSEVSETTLKRKRDGNDEQHRKRPNNEHFKQNGFNAQKPVFQARKSSLLEKLLADDIRHERNVVLQCIRHIVNKNFFGMNNKKS